MLGKSPVFDSHGDRCRELGGTLQRSRFGSLLKRRVNVDAAMREAKRAVPEGWSFMFPSTLATLVESF